MLLLLFFLFGLAAPARVHFLKKHRAVVNSSPHPTEITHKTFTAHSSSTDSDIDFTSQNRDTFSEHRAVFTEAIRELTHDTSTQKTPEKSKGNSLSDSWYLLILGLALIIILSILLSLWTYCLDPMRKSG